MKDAFYYLYILIFAGFLLSSAPTCHAEKADFDIKKAKFSQTMEYETDSAKEAAVQKEVKQGTDAELYKLYNYIFNNDALLMERKRYLVELRRRGLESGRVRE